MSYHLTRSRRRRPRSMGDIGLPPLPDLPPVPPAPPDPSEDSGKTWFEELTEPITKVFGTPTLKPPVIKPSPMTVPRPARTGMSTSNKLMIAGGAIALVALMTR